MKAQCKEEGLAVTDEAIMQESTFAKNALITVHGRTPYNGLLGRTPNLLSEFESPSLSTLSDTAGGAEGGHTRHAIRLRELSIQSMVEGSPPQLKPAPQAKSAMRLTSFGNQPIRIWLVGVVPQRCSAQPTLKTAMLK